jgi:hypothetical protein
MDEAGCEPTLGIPAALIAGGLLEDLKKLDAMAVRAGASYKPLPINISSHTSLLAEAVGPGAVCN